MDYLVCLMQTRSHRANAMANNFDVAPGKDPDNAAECCPGIWSIESIENNMSAYVHHFLPIK